MSVHLYVAPAACGKTTWAMEYVREAARDMGRTPRVCVPTLLQAQSWRRRLARAGGAMGVHVYTFDSLFAACLNGGRRLAAVLADAQRYRILRHVIADLPLAHYAPLVDRPGFAVSLQQLVAELKAACVTPDAFRSALAAVDTAPRLRELAAIYDAYESCLHDTRSTDRPGLGWLALERLRQDRHACRWPLLVVDGFDDLSQVQIDLLIALADRVDEIIITLTGTPPDDSKERSLAHRRFIATRRRIESALGVTARELPGVQTPKGCHPLFHGLEEGLFQVDHRAPLPNDGDMADVLEMIEAPDRAAEVRAALRWLKHEIVCRGARPDELALLARNLLPYRELVRQTAREMELPVRVVDGFPLASNPAVAALRDLLRLCVSLSREQGSPGLPRRPVVEAWRSPYFDWMACAVSDESDASSDADEPCVIGITEGDADALDAVARWGRVVGELEQWREAFARLAALPDKEPAGEGEEDTDPLGRGAMEYDDAMDEEDAGADDAAMARPVTGMPTGQRARVLAQRFERFVRRLTPPEDLLSFRRQVAWLEALMGGDPALEEEKVGASSLRMVVRARDADDDLAARDVAALQEFKEILRGLVWAQETLGDGEEVSFASFVGELMSAVDAASYRPPAHIGDSEILVADVVQARGIPFRAVAILGLSEGEFPASQREDPLLRDADRDLLRRHGVVLNPSTLSAEAGYFYEAITRPYARLLLTRPRLADSGAPWESSPYWEEIIRLTTARPHRQTGEAAPDPALAASWPEALEALAPLDQDHEGWQWVAQHAPQRIETLRRGADVLDDRLRRKASPYNGELTSLAGAMAHRYGPEHVWSAGRIERYRTCPFSFFVSNVLWLEPRQEPTQGLDSLQLGNIYHHILEGVFSSPTVTDPANVDQLLAVLPEIADRVLDAAPDVEGFRETAWWRQTRAEIVEQVRRSLEGLADISRGYELVACELRFAHDHPLVIGGGEDRLLLQGVIDRVDRNEHGLRVIDYKTGGASAFTPKALQDGRKLQLPLYALAVRDAFGLGDVAEGFYWHIRNAQKSKLFLSGYEGGVETACAVAVGWVQYAVHSIRDGEFSPSPPREGCPPYCAAAGFCWHYRPSRRG